MMTMNRRGRLDVAESRSIIHGYKLQSPGPEGRALRYKVSLLIASAVALLRRLVFPTEVICRPEIVTTQLIICLVLVLRICCIYTKRHQLTAIVRLSQATHP